MRKQILYQILALFVSSLLWGASVELTWTANTEPDLASYKVYQSFTDGVWGVSTATVVAPATTYTIANVLDGTYWYALTAVDTAGNESDKSISAKIVVNVAPPAKPTGLKLLLKN